MHHDALKRLISRALASGGRQVSASRVVWDVAGDCERPVYREVASRPDATPNKHIVVRPGRAHGLILELALRCKACSRCLRLRAGQWKARALREWEVAPRTWFGSLTIAPDHQHRFLEQARRKEALQGVDFDGLSELEQFRCRHREISRELTLWLKRLRKESEAPLRYLLVAEAHKSGAPHYHCLIHEVHPAFPVRQRALKQQWKLGFSDWKLVTDKAAAGYLCKYLSKDARARVRASVGYGGKDDLSPSLKSVNPKGIDHLPRSTILALPNSDVEGTAHGCASKGLSAAQSRQGVAHARLSTRARRRLAVGSREEVERQRLRRARERTRERVAAYRLREQQRDESIAHFIRCAQSIFAFSDGGIRAAEYRRTRSGARRVARTFDAEFLRDVEARPSHGKGVVSPQPAVVSVDRVDHGDFKTARDGA